MRITTNVLCFPPFGMTPARNNNCHNGSIGLDACDCAMMEAQAAMEDKQGLREDRRRAYGAHSLAS